jgi:hypothetical protein
MKIALCFSGQPRSWKAGYEYYKRNLLDKHDVDVFIHTWDTLGMEWYNAVKEYQCRNYKIDPTITGDADFTAKYTNTPNAEKWPPAFTVSALYSTLRCCLLKIDKEILTQQYDWVIKTRFDFALSAEIPFDQLEKGKLYMPPCRYKAWGDWLGNDQFAVGDSDTMNKYMTTYLRMDRYYNMGVEMIGEEMLRANLLDNNLKNSITYIDFPPPFPPGPHNGTPHFLIRDDYEQWTDSSKN